MLSHLVRLRSYFTWQCFGLHLLSAFGSFCCTIFWDLADGSISSCTRAHCAVHIASSFLYRDVYDGIYCPLPLPNSHSYLVLPDSNWYNIIMQVLLAWAAAVTSNWSEQGYSSDVAAVTVGAGSSTLYGVSIAMVLLVHPTFLTAF